MKEHFARKYYKLGLNENLYDFALRSAFGLFRFCANEREVNNLPEYPGKRPDIQTTVLYRQHAGTSS